MRQFAIQALVDERTLWDVMKYLESVRAQGILTRPYYLEPAAGEEQPAALPAPNGHDGSISAGIRAAIHAALAQSNEPITTMTIINGTGKQFTRKQAGQVFAALCKAGEIKRVGTGAYVAANSRAAKRPPAELVIGSYTSRIRDAVFATLAKGEEVTTKGIRESTGITKGSVDRMMWRLNKDGVLKRIGTGIYTKGKAYKGAAL